ncbi:DUF2752 domain-containing protein [Saccharopolyspora mangrovi]|uniref:DUF2752 domain-containing protein n=1 Tax=Saccharopolyspora mangrovi TaxID=3082379 RepID=A0ABU6A8R1_9PSEU|nr:DUF2752 domain-containing protein [Saccharopolyspora sp. S2-29]MEB3367895.1 DUF2752 domain-containing protein [Saccharopolyspora sp. S2-29]
MTEIDAGAGRPAPASSFLHRVRLPAATVLVGCVGAALVLAADPTSDAGFPLPPCPIKLLTGLDCPGCGITRTLFSLLRADLPSALHYNALAVLLLPLLAWAWTAWVARRFGRALPTWTRWRWSPHVLLAVVVLWVVVRNAVPGLRL